ncbi:MAG: hydantoinase B/oxoprolinase family protein [Pseudomonadota bacterium]
MFAHGETTAAPIVAADALTTVEGPALIVRPDTQIALPLGWRATAEDDGLIRLTRASGVQTRAIALDRPDPITLELFNRRFMGVAEAMGAALERTAHSVNIKERLDFSCALFDEDGGLVANAPHMPVHLGSMGASVRAVRDRHPTLAPGDAFALNNPYAGGTHLPDITVVMPVFMPGAAQAAFYVAARGHHADVGGVQPGSMPPFSKTIDEEGVLLDAIPIMRGGGFLEADTRAALGAGPWPARAPDRNIADLKAQIAACQAGAAAVAGMIEGFGGEVVAAYMTFVQQNATASVRRAIGKSGAQDALRAELTLGGSAAIGESRGLSNSNPGDAAFRSRDGRYAGLLTLNLPLERTAERNVYRQSLLELENAVRNYQGEEDSIKQTIRANLRELLEYRESLVIQSLAVKLANRRVASTDLLLQAGRAEIRDLLEAQGALLSAENSLTAAVVSYRMRELELQSNLGVLSVSVQGEWQEMDLSAFK